MSDIEEAIKKATALAEAPVDPGPGEPEPGAMTETPEAFVKRIQDGGIKDEDIPDTIRQDWMRSVFGMTPFSYTADVFGGKAHVTFCEPPPAYRNAYRTLSLKASRNGGIQTLAELSILLYLKEITGEFNMAFEPPKRFLSPIDEAVLERVVDEEYGALCAKIPSALARMLPTLWLFYSSLVGHLTEQAMPASF